MGWKLLAVVALLVVLQTPHNSDALLIGRHTGITTRGKIYKAVCEAEDEDLIGWFDKNDKHVTSDQIFDKLYIARYGPKVQSLYIQDVKVADGGNYTCKGSKSTRNFELYVEFYVTQFPSSIEINSTQNAIIPCSGIGYPKPIYRWYRNWQRKEIFTSGRFRIFPNGSLSIKDVKVDDASNYTCRIIQLQETQRSREERKHLQVTVYGPPQLVVKESTTRVIYSYKGNKKIKIACKWMGFPLPKKTITRPHGRGLLKDVKTSGRTIYGYLDTEDDDDFGEYVCGANNFMGARTHTIVVKEADRPLSPSNVSSSTHCGYITVNWNPPQFDGGIPISSYEIQLLHQGTTVDEANSGSRRRRYTFNGNTIEPATRYTVRVRASNHAKQGLWATLQVTSDLCPPRGKIEITNRQTVLNSTSFTLTWTGPPDDGGDPSMRYTIEYSKQDKDGKYTHWITIKDVSDKYRNISGLEGGNKYMFHVVAVNIVGRSEPGNKEFEILDVVATKRGLGPPRGKIEITNRQTVLNSTSFMLTWTGPPDDGGDPSMRYTIEYSKQDKDGKYTHWTMIKDVSDKYRNISGLEGGNKYMFHVVAVNIVGRSEPGNKEFEILDGVATKRGLDTITQTDVDVIYDIKINCTSMAIQVDLTLKENHYLDLESFQLRDPSCTPQEKSQSHVTLRTRLDGCGTTNKHQNESVTYYNSVTARVVQSKSKMHLIEFPFSCTFIKRRTIGTPSFQLRKRVSVVEEGFGNFSFEMNLFKSSLYKIAFDVSEYPVNVPITNKLFAQTKLLATDKNLEALTYTCVATPSPDPRDALQYLFIEDGCVIDKTVKFNPVPGVTQEFQMLPFKFRKASSSIVYLHCHVMVCHKDDAESRCHKGCIPKIRKARDVTVSHRSSIHRVTLGPINVETGRDTGAREGEEETSRSLGVLLIAIFGTLIACFLLFAALSYIMRHAIFRQSTNGLAHKIPEAEPLEMTVVS